MMTIHYQIDILCKNQLFMTSLPTIDYTTAGYEPLRNETAIHIGYWGIAGLAPFRGPRASGAGAGDHADDTFCAIPLC
jgi:hypothetical protein